MGWGCGSLRRSQLLLFCPYFSNLGEVLFSEVRYPLATCKQQQKYAIWGMRLVADAC